MSGQRGFWLWRNLMRGCGAVCAVAAPYARSIKAGDPLVRLDALMPWAVFRKPLAKAMTSSDGSQGVTTLSTADDIQDPGAAGAG